MIPTRPYRIPCCSLPRTEKSDAMNGKRSARERPNRSSSRMINSSIKSGVLDRRINHTSSRIFSRPRPAFSTTTFSSTVRYWSGGSWPPPANRRKAKCALFKEWGAYQDAQLEYSRGDDWDHMLRQGTRLLERLAQDDRIRIHQPRDNMQVKLVRSLSSADAFRSDQR